MNWIYAPVDSQNTIMCIYFEKLLHVETLCYSLTKWVYKKWWRGFQSQWENGLLIWVPSKWNEAQMCCLYFPYKLFQVIAQTLLFSEIQGKKYKVSFSASLSTTNIKFHVIARRYPRILKCFSTLVKPPFTPVKNNILPFNI